MKACDQCGKTGDGRMARYDHMLRALASGDPRSAPTFWRSKQWTDPERARARRLLRAAAEMTQEVLR